jgi:hypothetical protein
MSDEKDKITQDIFRYKGFSLSMVAKNDQKIAFDSWYHKDSNTRTSKLSYSIYLVIGHTRSTPKGERPGPDTRKEVWYPLPNIMSLKTAMKEMADAIMEGEDRIYVDLKHGRDTFRSVDSDFSSHVGRAYGNSGQVLFQFDVDENENKNEQSNGVRLTIGEPDRQVFLPVGVFLGIADIIATMNLHMSGQLLVSSYFADRAAKFKRTAQKRHVSEEEA